MLEVNSTSVSASLSSEKIDNGIQDIKLEDIKMRVEQERYKQAAI